MTHPSILLTILTEALKATPQNLSAEERLKDIESRKVALEEEIAKLKQDIEAENTPWRPKPGKEVWMFMPACDRPIQIAAFDPDRAFHAHNLALGHIFKTEDEATSGWNGRIVDQALRNHPKRVRIEDIQVGTESHVFGLVYDEDHGYVHVHSAHSRTAARRCLGSIVFSTEEAAEEAIAAFDQEALRDFAAYCAR